MLKNFIRYGLPSLVVLLGIGGYGLAQYTNWPNTSTGQTIGSIFLASVLSSPPTNYQSGQVQPATQDTSGNLNINCKIGCSASSDPSNGPVGPGNAATASKLAGAVFNSSLPTAASGQQVALQADSSGRLIDGANGPVSPGSAAAYAKLAGGQFNTSAPTLSSGQMAALQLDGSGNLNVNIKAGQNPGGTSSNFAAAFPSAGTAIGAKNGSNMVNLTADASSNLNVNCAIGCSAASDTSNGPVVPGAVASTSKLNGIQFNSSPPTLANTQQAAMQGDSHANLLVNLNTPLPAGANVIGQVGGTTVGVTVTPTVTVGAYSAGFCVGGLMTFNNATRPGGPGSALTQAAVVTDVSGQDSNIDIVLFRANPTNSTFTDHAACTVANADLTKIVGVIVVNDCHLLSTTAPGVCQGQQQAMPLDLGAGNTTAWAVAISRGTPTYTASNNVAVRLEFLQD